jgi:hypothetical protein
VILGRIQWNVVIVPVDIIVPEVVSSPETPIPNRIQQWLGVHFCGHDLVPSLLFNLPLEMMSDEGDSHSGVAIYLSRKIKHSLICSMIHYESPGLSRGVKMIAATCQLRS